MTDHRCPEPEAVFINTQSALITYAERLQSFIADEVTESDRAGVVIALDGGINSALITLLSVRALGPNHVFGVLLPAFKRGHPSVFDAEAFATTLGIEYDEVNLAPIRAQFDSDVIPAGGSRNPTAAMLQTVDRLRTITLYYAANTTNRLVLGTLERTDWLLGQFTKFGPHYGDILPLVELFKSEVHQLADALDANDPPATLPDRTANRPPGYRPPEKPCLSREMTDVVLYKLTIEDTGIQAAARNLDIDPDRIRPIAARTVRTKHKRRSPATPSTAQHGSIDWFHEIELRIH